MLSGGDSISVSGLNFGIVDASPTSTIGSTFCTTVSWVSTSSVLCASAVGSGSQLDAVVTVAAFVATSQAAFSFDGVV